MLLRSLLHCLAEKNNSSQGEQSNAYVFKPVEWGTQTDKNCETCKRCEGGEARKNGGKPGINSCNSVIEHIRKIKSPLLYNDPDSFTVTTANQLVDLSEEEYKCDICRNPHIPGLHVKHV